MFDNVEEYTVYIDSTKITGQMSNRLIKFLMAETKNYSLIQYTGLVIGFNIDEKQLKRYLEAYNNAWHINGAKLAFKFTCTSEIHTLFKIIFQECINDL